MIDVVTNRNCVYQTAYHVIWCPKYRRDVLVGDVAAAVEGMLDTLTARMSRCVALQPRPRTNGRIVSRRADRPAAPDHVTTSPPRSPRTTTALASGLITP